MLVSGYKTEEIVSRTLQAAEQYLLVPNMSKYGHQLFSHGAVSMF